MATIFLIFIIFSFVYFFLQTVVIPGLQLEVKHNLLELLHKVRGLKSIYANDQQRHIISTLENSIVLTLNNINSHSIVNFALFIKSRSEKQKKDVKIKTKVNIYKIRHSGIPEIEKLYAYYFKTVRNLFFFSSGLTIIFLSPFLIIYYFMKWLLHVRLNRNELSYKLVEKCEEKHIQYNIFERIAGNESEERMMKLNPIIYGSVN